MRTIVRCMLLLALSVAASSVQADPFDPAASAKTVAPFIDGQTLGVVHLDLSRIEVDPLIDKFIELVPEAGLDAEEMRVGLGQFHSALREGGFEDLYLIVSLADVPEKPPFVIAPMTDSSDADAFGRAWLRLKSSAGSRKKDERVERLGDVLFLGSARTLQRLKRGEPDRRPQLVDAFRAAGDTAVQLLLLPTADDRRVIEELMPNLPEEVGGGPSTIVTRGLLWAAVGLDAPPKISVRLVIQSEDRPAAQALRDKLVSGLRILALRAKAFDSLRKFDAAAALLTPKVEGDRLTLVLDEENRGITTFLAAITPPLEEARALAARRRGIYNLKRLGLAMHNFENATTSFPAQANFDANGKPLLSWRVHLLAFLEEQKLYDQFHLDEPWDSEHNRKLIEKMPDVYRSPLSKKGRKGYSSYVLPVHEETFCPGRRGVKLKEIADGTVNTIMIVEVGDDQAVIWTKPEDLPFDPQKPAKGLGGLFKDGFLAAFCDGHVSLVPHEIAPKLLRALFSRARGDAASVFYTGEPYPDSVP